jgi:hypothetical protein
MNERFVPEHEERFASALRRFDEENSRDPNLQSIDDTMVPRELVYSRWLTEWVLKLAPEASETLRLAARAAHLCRWTIPRHAYPPTRGGYLRWREELKQFQAQKAAGILSEIGYPEATIAQVQGLISKRAFPKDPESRVLEDALCLVFLEHQFADLAAKSSPEKMVNAVQKTWKKMTPKGREIARGLSCGQRERALLERALSPKTEEESKGSPNED